MAPDGVLAKSASARLLAFTSMHRLEVIDVSVRLVEVTVMVVVVAIPHVERREERVNLRGRKARVELRLVPGVHLVDQEAADVARADDAAAVVAAVGRWIVRDGHPVSDEAVHGVAAA